MTPLDFYHIPALIKILATFGVILFLGKFFPLYIGLIVGGAVIGLWMGMDFWNLCSLMWDFSRSSQSLWLALTLALILMLSDLLGKSGRLQRIVAAFGEISPGPKFTLVALPALIGLLPMPGGAVFSAPMVGAMLTENPAPLELKAAINYWFRHIVEFWWPLYPGIVLAVSLFGVQSWKLTLSQSPLTLGAVAGGVAFILRGLPIAAAPHDKMSRGSVGRFVREILPIIIVIGGMFVFHGLRMLVGAWWNVEKIWPDALNFVLALGCAISTIVVTNRVSAGKVASAFFNQHVLYMFLIIVGIMSFKGILTESKVIEALKDELADYNIPSLAIVAILPFVAGMVTGIAMGFVGAAFPLVVSLVPHGASPYPYCLLAYGFGFVGMMLSPVHLCMLVNNEYFHANLMGGYRYLWKPALVCIFFTIFVFRLYECFF
uniref:DUF401 family protein n=1 Tax=Desulfomonile tiedjei TaxID=2358 RepID=A0A7C4EXQ2_9BACT